MSDLPTSQNTSNSSFLHHLRFGCHQLALEGYKIELLLFGSGLTQANLNDIYGVASFDQFQTVFKNYLKYGGPDVSFRLANKLRLSDLGPFGYLLLASESLEEALGFVGKFSPLVGPLMWMDHSSSNNEYLIKLHPNKNNIEETVQRFNVEYFITALNRSLSELSRKPVTPQSLRLKHSNPGAKDTYAMLPIDDIRFGQEHYMLSYDFKEIRRPLPFSDKTIKGCTYDLCEKLLQQLTRDVTVTSRVISILSSQPGEYPDIKTTASRLDMSPRTLRRRLADESNSFQNLVAEHRKQFALELLQRDHLPIQSVAYACGFSEVQNFSSAFKRWMGVSPTEYRSQLH